MINRNKRVISKILTVCAVAGLIPTVFGGKAYASDVKTLEAKDGIINTVIPYGDGKYVVDGEMEYNDSTEEFSDDAVLYYTGSSYKELNDEDKDIEIESGDDIKAYGQKYVQIGDDYFLDLSTGDVTDETISEDNLDDAQSALKKQVKKVERYNEKDETPALTLIKGNKFSKPFYEYNIEGYKGYTDVSGKYIDADYLTGNVYVIIDGSKKKFSNTDDKVTVGDKDYKLFVTNSTTIGQDKDNIYRLATLEVKEFDSATQTYVAPTVRVVMNSIDEEADKVVNTTGSAVTVSATDSQASMKVVQKISKAQASGDIDDAKYPNAVASYEFISNEEKDDVVALLDSNNVSFVDGKIISWKTSGGEVEVQALELKSKNGVTYLDETKADSEDYDALDVDANGNLWRLEGGKVYEYNNDEDWTQVYKVDGGMDTLAVYDKANLVVYSKDKEEYAFATGTASTGTTTGTENGTTTETGTTTGTETGTTTPAQKGWVKATDGTWSFVKEDGSTAKGWFKDTNGTWYFLNANGVMQTGWFKDTDGNWYFLNESGAMTTGWQQVSGTWYYLNASGAMQTGWVKDTDGAWYFLQANGAMAFDTTVDGYQLGSNGAWIQ